MGSDFTGGKELGKSSQNVYSQPSKAQQPEWLVLMFRRVDSVTLSPLSISRPVVGLNYVRLTVGCKDSQMLMNKILSY